MFVLIIVDSEQGTVYGVSRLCTVMYDRVFISLFYSVKVIDR